MSYWLYDLLAAAVLILFLVLGIKRGLILSLCSLLALLVALVGASWTTNALTPFLMERFAPVISEKLEDKIDQEDWYRIFLPEGTDQASAAFPTQEGMAAPGASDTLGGETGDFSLPTLAEIQDFLRLHDLPESLSDTLQEKLEDLLPQAQAAPGADQQDIGQQLRATVVTTLAERIMRAIVFLVSFLVILLLWRIISHALNLVAKLPVLHFLNKTGGAVLGLAKGVLLLLLAGAILRLLDEELAQRLAQESWLFGRFLSISSLGALK